MSGRLKIAMIAGLLLTASHAAAHVGAGNSLDLPTQPSLMQAMDGEQPAPAPSAMNDDGSAQRPASIMRSPAIAAKPRAAAPIMDQSFIEGGSVDTSQVLWIIIALLAVVGLAMSRVGRSKAAAAETFEMDVQPQLRSKVEAALDAALSAQSGPVRGTPGATGPVTIAKGHGAHPIPASKPPVRFDLPLVLHDPRPRFGKR